MTTRTGRSVLAMLVLPAALLVGIGPAVAHAPDPLIGWPAWNQGQVVRFRWMAGEVPPAAMQSAIKAGATDVNESKYSRAPTFLYDAAGTSTVEYGANVFCGINGLACADARNAPNTFRVAFRTHGHRFDWGVLRWCQLLNPVTNGCFDVENIMLDELGHVLGLGHHENFTDQRDYGDSVVQTVSRARPQAFWDEHDFGRCDIATLQTRYDMTSWFAGYSTCLDLGVDLAFASSATSIRAGSTVTFTATLTVADGQADGKLGDNPVSNRKVILQRRPIGGTWTTIATMLPTGVAGTYSVRQSPTATYEWRAVFPKPPTEGLRGRSSSGVIVSVGGCSGTGCPQSAPFDGSGDVASKQER